MAIDEKGKVLSFTKKQNSDHEVEAEKQPKSAEALYVEEREKRLAAEEKLEKEKVSWRDDVTHYILLVGGFIFLGAVLVIQLF